MSLQTVRKRKDKAKRAARRASHENIGRVDVFGGLPRMLKRGNASKGLILRA